MKIYYFSTPSCNPCRRFGPIIAELQEEFSITKVSIIDEPSRKLAQEYQISTVPTVVIVKDNKELGRFSGYRDKTATKNFLISKTD
jgi:thioredoxin-like negative regulator of GroEL